MFATDLICSNGHKFEACFSNRAAFELQKKEELIECPHCGDVSVKQMLSAVRIKKPFDRIHRDERPLRQDS